VLWRRGTAGRQDRLDFQYSLDATSLSDGTWIDVDALDFVGPDACVPGVGTTGATDGNSADCVDALGVGIKALAIADGASFWIRWNDFNASGADDGLAIDDFALSATGGPPLPVLSVDSISQPEGDVGTTLMTFTATLDVAAGPGGVSFVARTVDGSATEADNDYVGMGATLLTIDEGNSSQQMSILINGDLVNEPNESFTLEIDTLVGATAGTLIGTGTIENDDGATPIAVSIDDPGVTEGDAGTSNLSFTVSLDTPAPVGGISFDIATMDGTAIAGDDYIARSLNNQTITEGQSSYNFDVQIIGDLVNEATESFSVTLSNVSGNSGGSVDSSGTGTITDNDPLPRTIAELQGTGLASPFAGTVQITLGNVVTAVGSDLFAMQMPVGDGDPFSSDAIVVFTGGAPQVQVGDLVDVKGNLVEFFEFTEFTVSGGGLTVNVIGTAALPAPVVFDDIVPSPVPAVAACQGGGSTIPTGAPIEAQNFECFEAMLVSTSSGIINAPHQAFGGDPIAEPFFATGNRRVRREAGIDPAALAEPGLPSGIAVWDGNPELFELDVDRLGQLPNDVYIPGTRVSATGVIGFDFGDYELWPTAISINGAPAQIPSPAPIAGYNQISISSLNVENLFDTVDDPLVEDTVLTPAELELKLGKLSAYIRDVLNSPHVIGLIEIENQTAVDALIARIAADDPSVQYSGTIFPGNDPRGINNAFIWRGVTVDQVTQLRLNQLTNECSGTAPCTLHDRPTLLLEGSFASVAGVAQDFAVMVSHFRSLSGIDNLGNLDNANRVRRKRLEQAVAIAEEQQAFQSANPSVPLVSLGDFNAFEFTDGYADVMGIVRGDANVADDGVPRDTLFEIQDIYPAIVGNIVDPPMAEAMFNLPEDDRYSFLFGCGTNFNSVGCFAQALDHTILNAAAQPFYADFGFGRGNADARRLESATPLSPLRSSDHDGSVLILNFGDELLQDGFE
jgi:predicted extracellular nuclease